MYSWGMNNALTLLGLVGHQPSYGYDLKHSYDRLFGMEKPLAFGQVYATLARMIRDGYLEELDAEVGGGPERRRYAITPSGRGKLEDWLFTPDIPSPNLQSALFAKTVIALLIDDDANRLIDLQRARHMDQMRHLTRRKAAADLLEMLLCDHALFHIEADLRWMDVTAARLDALRETLRP